jgi:leucyl aminopeptidase
MQFHATGTSAARQRTACAIVGIHEGAAMTTAARDIDRASGGAIARLLRRGDFAGKTGEALPIVAASKGPAERILLVGLGPRGSFGRRPYRRAIVVATQWLAKSGAANAVSYLAIGPVPGLEPYYAARQAAGCGGRARRRREPRPPAAPRPARHRSPDGRSRR